MRLQRIVLIQLADAMLLDGSTTGFDTPTGEAADTKRWLGNGISRIIEANLFSVEPLLDGTSCLRLVPGMQLNTTTDHAGSQADQTLTRRELGSYNGSRYLGTSDSSTDSARGSSLLDNVRRFICGDNGLTMLCSNVANMPVLSQLAEEGAVKLLRSIPMDDPVGAQGDGVVGRSHVLGDYNGEVTPRRGE